MIYIDSLSERAIELTKLPIFNGLTCNPTIIKKDKPEWGFKETLDFLEELNGQNFIQGSLKNEEWFDYLSNMNHQRKINSKNFTIKLPWISDEASVYVPKLQKMGFKVCATAVYSLEQCYTAVSCGVEFVAVYYDRMKKSNIDPEKRISDMLVLTSRPESKTRILAASIKDIETANRLLLMGVPDLTLPLDIAEKFLKAVFPMNDCETFENDFKM